MATLLKNMQQKFKKVGEVRFGEKDAGGRPTHLTEFRFTSQFQEALDKVAQLYGGDVEPWPENHGHYQVKTCANQLKAIVPMSQIVQRNEVWGASGILRKCDGAEWSGAGKPYFDALDKFTAGKKPSDADWDRFRKENEALLSQTGGCLECGREGCALKDKYQCKPTTRIGLILEQAQELGLWLVTTGSYHAAAEIAGAVTMAQLMGVPEDGLLYGTVYIEKREVRRQGAPLKKFVVLGVRPDMDKSRRQPQLAAASVKSPLPSPIEDAAVAPPEDAETDYFEELQVPAEWPVYGDAKGTDTVLQSMGVTAAQAAEIRDAGVTEKAIKHAVDKGASTWEMLKASFGA